jgi:hypothetical protein
MRHTMITRAAVLLALLVGCGSDSDGDASTGAGGAAGAEPGGGAGGGSGAGGNPCPTTPAESAQNQLIFDALQPSCGGCHMTGARGYFASLGSFESLLVYQPALVTPGNPDGSRLVQLLEGTAAGNYTQMPVAGDPYAKLPGVMPMATIREWVTKLQAHTLDPRPAIGARRMTRIGAAEIVRALYQQLGLSDADFYLPAQSYSFPAKTNQDDHLYPVSSYDAIPAPYESQSPDRFASLGGGSAPLQLATDASLAPAFVGSLTQVSQRWCALALAKPTNAALRPGGVSTAAASTDAASVRATLRAWFLHFHAVDATDADLDRVFSTVFVPLEKAADTTTAYVGTCSYFVRHPDWVFY